MQRQYLYCRLDTDSPPIETFHLVEAASGALAGFLGLRMSLESFEDSQRALAYLVVEFVYIKEEYQGQGHARLFRSRIMSRAKRWITALSRDLPDDSRLEIVSASCMRGDQGEHFIRRLERRLSAYCLREGLRFSSCVE